MEGFSPGNISRSEPGTLTVKRQKTGSGCASSEESHPTPRTILSVYQSEYFILRGKWTGDLTRRSPF